MSSTGTPDPLTLLEGYLAQDPGNGALRAEAFETALRMGRPDRAEPHLTAGLASGAEPLGWALRRAHWLMARQDWSVAAEELNKLLHAAGAPEALQMAVRQDLALACLHCGRVDDGLAAVAPLIDATSPAAASSALQVLWLRLLHRAGRLDELMATARHWGEAGALAPDACGVAALAALDAEDLALSNAWSAAALARSPRQMEALVTQGSLALGRQDPTEARRHLGVALRINPHDGRALSALAFAGMLAGDWVGAKETFERALQFMPEHIGTWHGSGWLALLQGDLERARSVFTHALEMDRNFAESHGGMAVVHARTGETEAAQAAIRTALRLDRNCLSAHYAQAILDGEAEDADKLQRLAIRLLGARRAAPSQG